MSNETIMLTNSHPVGTQIFSIGPSQGASYDATEQAWRITQLGGDMTFTLNLSGFNLAQLGVTLVLNLKSLDYPGETYGPLDVSVNGTSIVSLWDPPDENDYYNISWAIPPDLYGENSDTMTITLTLDVTATTSIAIREVTCALFEIQAQTQSLWCWLAAASSISFFYDFNSTWTQCILANTELNQNSCCTNPGSTQCNQAGLFQNALTSTGNLASTQAGTISAAQIQAQTNAGEPVGIRIQWPNSTISHIIVATGVSSDLSMVLVQDPAEGEGTSYITWEDLVNNYTGLNTTWTNTFFTKV